MARHGGPVLWLVAGSGVVAEATEAPQSLEGSPGQQHLPPLSFHEGNEAYINEKQLWTPGRA